MARAVAEAGFPLHAWARRPISLDGLNGVPHVRHDHIGDLPLASDIVAVCVGTDDDVLRLAEQLPAGLRPGSRPLRGAGTDSCAVTARGLTGAHRLPELLEHLAS
ncbi:hypothetical protein [Streptomyces sp. RKAG290]|uniref:hypothetical protein n=1 Tax=Streptomyces sp. RKAG290 TaxID=2888348 RepID=UPI00203324AB|nr:hypothetical protein [Streptomyces sp. RKAG290]MCM2416071.1 hypothetical protein [Streptomyces sp. RKAG290]